MKLLAGNREPKSLTRVGSGSPNNEPAGCALLTLGLFGNRKGKKMTRIGKVMTAQTMAVMTSVAFLVGAKELTRIPASALAWQQAGDLRIVVLDGEDSVNIIEQGTAVPTLVEVRDRNDLPVSGASVTFLLGEGGTATLNAGLSQVAVTTNALGQAAVTVNPIASGAVQLQVTAAFQGQTATAAIVQTNFATLAEAAAAGAGATGGAGGGGGGGTGAVGGAAGGAGGGLGTGAIVGIAAAGAGAAVGGVTLAGGDDDGAGPGGGGNGGGVIGGTSPNNAPTAVMSITPDALGMAGLTRYRFDGSGSTDPDGDTLTYSWDFGDGTQGTGVTPRHVYDRRGTFRVTLTVRDGKDHATTTSSIAVGDLSGTFVSPPIDFSGKAGCEGEDILYLTQDGRRLSGTYRAWVPPNPCNYDQDDRGDIRGTVASSNNFVCPCDVTVRVSSLGDEPNVTLRGRVSRDLEEILLRFEGYSLRFRRE